MTSEKGQLATIRYDLSEAGCARNERYRHSEKGRATRKLWLQSEVGQESRQRYEQSESGQRNRKYHNALWLGRREGSEYLRNRFQMIYVERLPCAQCDEADTLKLCVDHIMPRALGGSHERTNLQVLCYRDHDTKTAIDIATIYRARMAI